ncbi:hypothetical protein LY78DRAFT_680365 [Colletotrichum sublineola]|uniref:Biotrophy-associated secreted protein 3 n=1 Tax=Colletotrichum sublineola TaxID=1173701 RepID=A0A066X848_COLSU|nr:hypothetical protein LY78DRAFT_680365 [Colletotrichum sublineola]KDN65328.1 hypothetical protein CSUB01_05310 [Colletotrichum sublineola]
MLSQTAIVIAALLQFALPASASFILCGGAPLGGGCPAGKGSEVACANICADCQPNCFGGVAKDLGATCCEEADGTVNVFCFRTGQDTC